MAWEWKMGRSDSLAVQVDETNIKLLNSYHVSVKDKGEYA